MRNRSNSGVRLDYYQRLVNRTILKHQNPVTGLLPASDSNKHAWIRDNVYSIMSVWGLAQAYRKTADLDEDRAKAYELEQAVVKLMRGLFRCMMMQVDKLEKFKHSQSPNDALHAKYCSQTGKTVVGDHEWGHLQIDAVSLYLLMLAQMTASGLQIIFTLDEVSFVQNLVFYIETAYRTPDYGIWERGDKTNHGLPELNSSSIGMAKAALEAINELDLFGARGGPASVIHVLPDEAQQCQAILHSMLPKESSSKEIDASLLTVFSFPAFAVDDTNKIEETRNLIQEKLEGKYGCCRFLRDGYRTALEDRNRLHYEPWELQVFEKIECQWPLFFAYMILDGLFNGNMEQVETYRDKLDDVLLKSEEGIPMMPEMYAVPKEKVEQELRHPNSQKRNAIGKAPQMWGESMYILGKLVQEGFLSPGELDPLNRRLVSEPKPDIVVQVVLLAEDSLIQAKMAEHGISIQTISEVNPIQVYPARVLAQIYSLLGKNKRLGLTGRPSNEIGLLATSKLYMFHDQILAFIPQMMDAQKFYLPRDMFLKIDMFSNDLDFLSRNWRMLGRPTVLFPLSSTMTGLPQVWVGGEELFRSICIFLYWLSFKVCIVLIFRLRVDVSKQFLDPHHYYLTLDTRFSVDIFRNEVSYLKNSWKGLGRPTITFSIGSKILDESSNPPTALIGTIKKLQSGYIAGTRVHMGKLTDFITTSCVTKLSFLRDDPTQGSEVRHIFGDTFSGTCPRPRLLTFSSSKFKRRRAGSKSSVYGIVRRSRSIQVDPEHIPDRGPVDGSLHASLKRLEKGLPSDGSSSSPGSPDIEPEDTTLHIHLKGGHHPVHDRTPSPCGSPKLSAKSFHHSNSTFASVHGEKIQISELIDQLNSSEVLHEQADIIHYLFLMKGPDWEIELGEKPCTIKELLVELYEKAGHWKQWWLVRHTAGMLKKRVEELALAATDLLVRQKQLSVGLPPDREKVITCPLPPDELANMIFEACGDDRSTASLTQELLIYLAMFIRTEPKLFREMLRLRVGLIIQVMASELARTLKCSGDEASEHLLNLSPFEMKTLLHHILSGKEFVINAEQTDFDEEFRLSVKTKKKGEETTEFCKLSRSPNKSRSSFPHLDNDAFESADDDTTQDRQGQWLRRRRLDGALNRVPVGFYPRVWKALTLCHGLVIEGQTLPQSLTREMTPGEFKFALHVEMALNCIPQPEYRQLMVEALMVLTLLTENDWNVKFDQYIQVDRLVQEANTLFLQDQKMPQDVIDQSRGAANVCLRLYDTAPSGRYGTMSYLTRALAKTLPLPVDADGSLECVIT